MLRLRYSHSVHQLLRHRLQSGEMAYDILVNGKDPATMDIEFVPENKLTKEYDAARCKALGVKVVDGYKAIEG